MSAAVTLIGLLSCLCACAAAQSLRSQFEGRGDLSIGARSSATEYLLLPDKRLEAALERTTPRNVTVASGKTAYLSCRVRHLGERTVSRAAY